MGAMKLDIFKHALKKLREKADAPVQSAIPEDKLRAAYKKYAPQNQSFDDFRKMFTTEAEFDEQVAAWADFEPDTVKVQTKRDDILRTTEAEIDEQIATLLAGLKPDIVKPLTKNDDIRGGFNTNTVYNSAPYSTYDPELSRKLKAIDAAYATEIVPLEQERRRLFTFFHDIQLKRQSPLYKELDKIEQVAAARLGRRPTYDDWDGPELQDLAGQRNDLRDRTSSPREPDYSPEELAIYQKEQLLENLIQGYKVARDYEKSKLIDASISKEVADTIARTRRQELIDIIANDDTLFSQAQNFSNLSIADKQEFLRALHARLDQITHVKGYKPVVFEDPESGIVANALRQYNNKPLNAPLTINDVLETVVHEQSHEIDRQVPDLGMLGAQKAKEHIELPFSMLDTQHEDKWDWETMSPITKTYSPLQTKEMDMVYKAHPTEFSAYHIGSFQQGNPESMMQQIIAQRAKR